MDSESPAVSKEACLEIRPLQERIERRAGISPERRA
jgi:hypothetical protein